MWQVIIRSKWTVFGAGLLAGSTAAPIIGLAVRPVVRSLVRAGLLLQREGSTWMEGIKEEFEDIVAEARSEMDGKSPAIRSGHAHGREDERSKTAA